MSPSLASNHASPNARMSSPCILWWQSPTRLSANLDLSSSRLPNTRSPYGTSTNATQATPTFNRNGSGDWSPNRRWKRSCQQNERWKEQWHTQFHSSPGPSPSSPASSDWPHWTAGWKRLSILPSISEDAMDAKRTRVPDDALSSEANDETHAMDTTEAWRKLR